MICSRGERNGRSDFRENESAERSQTATASGGAKGRDLKTSQESRDEASRACASLAISVLNGRYRALCLVHRLNFRALQRAPLKKLKKSERWRDRWLVAKLI